MTTRRHFLRSITATSVMAGVSRQYDRGAISRHVVGPAGEPLIGADDPALRALAMRAIDAARAAGASYADVRLTSDRTQTVSTGLSAPFGQVDVQGAVYAGVRALFGGFWGFASSSDCTPESLVRLARDAVAQAKVNDWGTAHPVTLDDAPPSSTGSWRTPMVRDPFQVSAAEKTDFLHDLLEAPEVLNLANISVNMKLSFRRQEKVFASTTDTFLTQTLTWVGPSDYTVTYFDPKTWEQVGLPFPLVPLQSGGYELVGALRPRDLPSLVEEMLRLRSTSPLGFGRYDLVLDAYTVAAVVRSTIGYATEFDRVQGNEVNAVGTSYLAPTTLGTTIASPHVTVTGSRSLPHGPAAVKWDDDGVEPSDFPLVRDGVLVDFLTDRAQAPALSDWYRRTGKPVRSHGCATADSAADMPMIQPPDLVLQPSSHDLTFEQLVADTNTGIAVLHGDCTMDTNQGTGVGHGHLFEIVGGRLGRYYGTTSVFQFHSTELWKGVDALGGPSSTAMRGFTASKGEPRQDAQHGVVAVPMRVRNVVVINPMRI